MVGRCRIEGVPRKRAPVAPVRAARAVTVVVTGDGLRFARAVAIAVAGDWLWVARAVTVVVIGNGLRVARAVAIAAAIAIAVVQERS